jgi:chromosome segregation ATPase
MVGAIHGSTATKLTQSTQSGIRGPNEMEKPRSRDAKAILAFSSPEKAVRNDEHLTGNEIDDSLDTDQIIDALRAENAELRQRLASLEETLQHAEAKGEDWGEQDREYARMMEEKTDVIRELHLKIQALQASSQAHTSPQPATQTPGDADLVALSEELERERAQLKEDETQLMQQMRAMEVQMSRERAEIARQRADIDRLHVKMQDELEQASREATLRERMQPLMRQHQAMMRGGSAEPPSRLAKVPAKTPDAQPGPPATTSGIFRRLFGAGG